MWLCVSTPFFRVKHIHRPKTKWYENKEEGEEGEMWSVWALTGNYKEKIHQKFDGKKEEEEAFGAKYKRVEIEETRLNWFIVFEEICSN